MTFVKWGMAAALALAISPAYADHHEEKSKEMTQARQEAQEQKAEAQKDVAEAKTEAQKDVNEAKKEAREKTAEAEKDAREKTAEADREMREKTSEAQKEMQEEGREVRASDDRTRASGTAAAERRGGDADKAPLSATAKETLKKIHASSQMEVGMARIAKDKAENDKVKDLADKIESDHKDAADKAAEIARERNVELAAHDEMSKNRKHVEQMQNMQGAAFDRHYAQMMEQEHKKEIAELRKAQTKLRANKADEDVAKLVDDVLPKMEEHQRMAMEARSEIRGEQRQGRRGSGDATSPSRSDSSWGTTDGRSGETRNSATRGNNTRPDELIDEKDKSGPESGTKAGEEGKKY
jgi:putative membrane protein